MISNTTEPKKKESIRLLFSFSNQMMHFIIIDRLVYYTDKIWGGWIQIVPKDERVLRKVLMSRNKIPKQIIHMFNLSKDELEEYDNAKTNNEVAQIIIKDAKSRGLKLEGKWEDEIR